MELHPILLSPSLKQAHSCLKKNIDSISKLDFPSCVGEIFKRFVGSCRYCIAWKFADFSKDSAATTPTQWLKIIKRCSWIFLSQRFYETFHGKGAAFWPLVGFLLLLLLCESLWSQVLQWHGLRKRLSEREDEDVTPTMVSR